MFQLHSTRSFFHQGCRLLIISRVTWQVRTAHARWKITKISKKLHHPAVIFASYRKLLSLNRFPMTNLRPHVESMHMLFMCRHFHHMCDVDISISVSMADIMQSQVCYACCCHTCSGGPVLLSLSHAYIHTAVHQRYIKSLGGDQELSLHRLIAGMFNVITMAV